MSEVRRTNKVLTLLVTCLGTFVILLDTSIVTRPLYGVAGHDDCERRAADDPI